MVINFRGKSFPEVTEDMNITGKFVSLSMILLNKTHKSITTTGLITVLQEELPNITHWELSEKEEMELDQITTGPTPRNSSLTEMLCYKM